MEDYFSSKYLWFWILSPWLFMTTIYLFASNRRDDTENWAEGLFDLFSDDDDR
jgi:hypothetical protein